MGEANRRKKAGLPPRGPVVEEGVSKLLDGDDSIRCGHCREPVIPQAMICYGDCHCGSSALSIHASQKVDRPALAHALMGLISALLQMYCTRRSPDGASHYCQPGNCPLGNGDNDCIPDESQEHRAVPAGMPHGNA